jgi:DNA-nicking Smr family endonuclease
MILEIDVHGMSVKEASYEIDRSLKHVSQSVTVIRIIHGYSHGQAIRNMVRKRYRSHPKIDRVELSMNPGVTDLILRRNLHVRI